MCGIVGAIANRNIIDLLLTGLQRLEYRGYDSAGLAVINANHELKRIRRVGKVGSLKEAVTQQNLQGNIGIAHSRWATHGTPTEENAHPHISGQVALVHNGIIENYMSLKEELIALGYSFTSETDTEVIAHLINHQLKTTTSLLNALQKVTQKLEGAYAIAVIEVNNPDSIVVARLGSPLVIGVGESENFLASDQLALLGETKEFIYLEEGDTAELTSNSIKVYDKNFKPVERAIHETDLKYGEVDKGEYDHFMQKEIFEQPTALLDTIEGRLGEDHVLIDTFGRGASDILEKVEHVQIIACGTSYNAGMVARYWFEDLAGISCDVEIASEFRYRNFVTRPNSLLITLSQSGETADTLAALRLAKERGYMSTMTICNVAGSSLVRESDLAVMTRAGVEIGVASTKAFTTQLATLLMLVCAIGQLNKKLDKTQQKAIVQALKALPEDVKQTLASEEEIKTLAQEIKDQPNALFIGRGEFYPIAMEGALKLKEISYIHAESYAGGELKHGSLALIEKNFPVVALAPNNELLEKLKSNISEVIARDGKVFAITAKEADFKESEQERVLAITEGSQLTAPIYYTIPMQLLAYHVALAKGTNVDQPRNLAKAVTVE